MKVTIHVDVPGDAHPGVSSDVLRPLFNCVIDAVAQSSELFGSVCNDNDEAIGTYIIEDA